MSLKQEAAEALAASRKALKILTSPDVKFDSNMSQDMAGLVSRLEAVAARLEKAASQSEAAHSGGDSDGVSPYVVAFDDLVADKLKAFLDLSAKIGGDVKTQADMIDAAFKAQRNFLITASKSKKPSDSVLQDLLKAQGQQIQNVTEFREKSRGSPYFNHLSAISESVAAVAWVAISPAPGPHVKEMKDASQFYTNRVLKEYKEKDKTHVDWSRSWLSFLDDLQAYIKQHHTTGVSWNPKGGDAKAGAAAPPPPAAGGPPPPPPPGPPPPVELLTDGGSGGDKNQAARGALFADLNKGFDVTKGLKKVTDDMKTHKNPALRSGPQPYKAPAAPKPGAPKAAAAAAPVKKPPKTELQQKKWIVEYHDNNKNIVIDDTNIKQTVYAFRCTNSTIQVKGKVNSITLDSCKKTAIVFEDLVSAFETINCQSIQAQTTGKVPTVSIDKTDGFQIYLNKDTLGTEFVSAKSSEMNILVPTPDGDFTEMAVPEQFKTTFNPQTKKLVTEVSDIA